jgi:hypothetical protein
MKAHSSFACAGLVIAVVVSVAGCAEAKWTYQANVVSCADQKPIPDAKVTGVGTTATTDASGAYNDTRIGLRSDTPITVEKAGYSKKTATMKPDVPTNVCLDPEKH